MSKVAHSGEQHGETGPVAWKVSGRPCACMIRISAAAPPASSVSIVRLRIMLRLRAM